MTVGFPQVRLRRYRQTASIRALTGMPVPPIQHFIWPVIVVDGTRIREPIPSLPGQYLFSIDSLVTEVEPLVKRGIGGILLFGKVSSELKQLNGDYAWSSSGLVQRAIQALKSEFPELTVFSDAGLSGYTTHGNNGILNEATGCIDNDASLLVLAKIALSHANAGADCIAPSGMMDGQVACLREALDHAQMNQTLIMSYSAKFASNLYDTFPVWSNAPVESEFRSSVFQSSCPLMPTYCAAADNLNVARREVLLDELEGADIVMVKPATFYLDVISEVKRNHLLPVAAYNVSGEYSMIHATAEKGWGRLYPLARESLLSIRRAGADILITYWANQYDRIFNERDM